MILRLTFSFFIFKWRRFWIESGLHSRAVVCNGGLDWLDKKKRKKNRVPSVSWDFRSVPFVPWRPTFLCVQRTWRPRPHSINNNNNNNNNNNKREPIVLRRTWFFFRLFFFFFTLVYPDLGHQALQPQKKRENGRESPPERTLQSKMNGISPQKKKSSGKQQETQQTRKPTVR